MGKSKRMINCDFVNASSFKLKISNRAKLLYFFMMSNADDKGFVDNTDELIELLNINDMKFNTTSSEVLLPDNYATALDELNTKGLVYCFDDKHQNTIHLIKHWYYHNTIPKERVKPSNYEKYLNRVSINADGEYVYGKNVIQPSYNCDTSVIQPSSSCNTDVTQLSPQINERKESISKEIILNSLKDLKEKNKPIKKEEATSLSLVDVEIKNDLSNEVEKQYRFSQELFNQFWRNYPRKVGKQKCINWFKSHKVGQLLLDKMIEALSDQKQNDQWQRDGGQFIPHPYTWLNQGRWDDEAEIDLSVKPTDEQIAEQEQVKQEFIQARANEKVSLLERRLAEAEPNSPFAYSLELQIKVAKGELTQARADELLEHHGEPTKIDFTAITKGIKKI